MIGNRCSIGIGCIKRFTEFLLIVCAIFVVGTVSSAWASNTKLIFDSSVPSKLCPSDTLAVRAKLTQQCGSRSNAPLTGRWIYFYINDSDCGGNYGLVPDDSALTDSVGIARATFTFPMTGLHSIKIGFLGEAKPSAGDPPNSACDPTKRVQLSSVEKCKNIEILNSECQHDPTANCPGDTTITLCTLQEICIPGFIVEDEDCDDKDGDGECDDKSQDIDTSYTSIGTLYGDTLCFTPTAPGTYEIILTGIDKSSNEGACTTSVTVILDKNPVVTLPSDTALFICDPVNLCYPLDLFDADCDIVSVITNQGSFSGTTTGFDQIDRITQLGGTITQIGGGAPGSLLSSALDFVPPVNSQSGVSVSLPDFLFASSVVHYGTFLSGIPPANSADHLLGSPTDLTFTSAGAGGPDGGNGNGSVSFTAGSNCILGFSQIITSCDGSNSDLALFTNSSGSGTIAIALQLSSDTVFSDTLTVASGTAGTGNGGVLVDLPDGIAFDAISISGVSNTVIIDAIAVRTIYSSTPTDICFTADTSGLYELVATASDACGNIGSDTMYIDITRNSAPEASAGVDKNFFQCSLSEICFGVGFSDIDMNIASTALVSGPGTLTGNQICFTPTSAGSTTFIIEAVDSCGLSDLDTVIVTVAVNSSPIAVVPDTFNLFQCNPELVCYTFSATDGDNDSLTWSLISGAGSISTSGEYCLMPTLSGIYTAMVQVADTCGATDTAMIVYDIQINSVPVADDPATPVSLFQCDPTQVCYQFTSTDFDGGALTWGMISGDGSLTNSGLWCFTPVTDGAYSILASVTDSCGTSDITTLTYNIDLNDAPIVAFDGDSSLFLCQPQEICISYSVSDPQGLTGLTETMVAGYGTIDTATNQICFTPTNSGSYDFIISTADACGDISVDTATVDVIFGSFASISCPTTVIDVSLCSTDTICQFLPIVEASSVSTSFGSWANDELCFVADTSGLYTIDIIANGTCGDDTCTVSFNVNIGQVAQISCPGPQTFFTCEADSLCVPIGINGSGLSVSVSPFGSYSAGSICFPADSSGLYEITVIANTDCGSDTCIFTADVTINTPPIAVNPTINPIDTFICVPDQICYQLSASDTNGGLLTWSRLSGDGSLSSNGLWCFTAPTAGSYSVVALVTDSCGASDTVTMSYNVTMNSAPTIALGSDTSLFMCTLGLVCWPYTTSDLDGNIDYVQLVSGTGYIDSVNSKLCFNPTTAGTYEFVVSIVDSCSAVGLDTISFTVSENSPPIVDAGIDQTIFGCALNEICLPISSSDIDGNLSTVDLISGIGTYNGSDICFTPTGSGSYQFVMRAVDLCGDETFDTVTVDYTLNTAPIANAGSDSTLFLCDATPICWPASSSDIDGNLVTSELISGLGTYDGSTICFTPASSGSYLFILSATDACGEVDLDSVTIDVTINSAPVCTVPNDTTIFQCTTAEVCLPVSAVDSDGNFAFCQIISGPGSIIAGNWCYTPTSDQVVTVVVRCQDDCGAFCESSFTVEFDINSSPTIALPADDQLFLCDIQEVCLPYTSSDPDDPRPTTISLLSGPGTLDLINSQICYTPTTSGTYTWILRIEDECGMYSEDTVTYVIDINTPPVAFAGTDESYFLCEVKEQCWAASCSDPDGNLLDCSLTGPGSYDGTQICFTPTSSGSYEFILEATDACGVLVADTVVITIINNSPPTIALDADFSQFLCAPAPICFGYAVNDLDGMNGLTEMMVSGFGTLDTLNDSVCFTPTTAGNYEFVLSVTDSCGAVALDTIVVTVTFGEQTMISCPSAPIDVSLCAIDTVCYQLDIVPTGTTVTTSFGTYSNGQLCFPADTTGQYIIEVIADGACGSDTCSIIFNVDIGSVAQINCPAPSSEFVCNPGDTVCRPITVVTPGATVTVSPIGAYSAGNICFPADTAGQYNLTVIASTNCGADTCIMTVDVILDTAPVIDPPPIAVIDTFTCTVSEVCYQFTGSDVDGGGLTWSRLNGVGAVDTNGVWCFTSTGSGAYTVDVLLTDSCGLSDTVNLTYNITINDAPTLTLNADTNYFLCGPETICRTYTVADTNANIVLEELIAGTATLDTALNSYCIVADTAGLYTIIIGITDECGLTVVDTINITVGINTAPVANAGPDQSYFLANPIPICWPAGCTDIDGNLTSCQLIFGVGMFDGSQICFTPDTAGLYTFILQATDACGAGMRSTHVDTALVEITFNSPPVCEMPADTSYFQCTPDQITRPVGATDIDSNFSHCEILSGPGSITNGLWVYTPTNDQAVTVSILCLDSMGAGCQDSFTVTFDINSPPTVDLGRDTTLFLCTSDSVCLPVIDIVDSDNNMTSIEVLSGNAVYDTGSTELCFYAQTGTDFYRMIVQATDNCGAVSVDTLNVTVQFNAPPQLTVPSNFTVFVDQAGGICFDIAPIDADNNLSGVTVSPVGSYNNSTGEICFNADTSGSYCFEITTTDACGASTSDSICVEVVIDQCIHVQIEKTHGSFQGHSEQVNIYQQGSGKPIGGFDLLIGYDVTALMVNTVLPGSLLENCGWEYFTFRQGANGNCGNGCPSGLLRIVALAETNNGANHPGCYLDDLIGSLATVDFLVSNDRNLECQYTPIRFLWLDCGDNTFSSETGDTLWISRDIFDFEWSNITDNTYSFPSYFGAPNECLVGGGTDKPAAIRCVDYTNGGVDIVCADSIDARGDLNLNGVAYEVADAVLYINYFVFGLSAFNVNVAGQIAASDVNADGIPLSVGDLVYLIRVVVGDTPAMPKLDPNRSNEVTFAVDNGTLEITDSDYQIRALFITLKGNVSPVLNAEAGNMEVRYSYDGENTRVLIYNLTGNDYLEHGKVLDIGRGVKVKDIEVGSFEGLTLSAKIGSLPEHFELFQNYPNPFNPTTTIKFALPVATEWELVIFNVLGQQVDNFSGKDDAGYLELEWDARKYASGVYFYRLRAGDYSASRKMVLLK